MFKVTTVSPEQATGRTAEIYASFPAAVGVPAPLQLMSASPFLLEQQFRQISHFRNHDNLSFRLMSCVRYLAASSCRHDYCRTFNVKLLTSTGADQAMVDALDAGDFAALPLEEEEKLMLAMVAKAIKDPASVSQEEIDALLKAGWTDADIVEVLFQAGGMIGGALVFNTLSK